MVGDKSKIEWTDSTWNPITGCTPVSPGCANCYAERMVKRFPHLHGFDNPNEAGIRPTYFNEVQFHPDRLDQPLRWKKPRRIFVCSMGDLFHEDVKDEWRNEVYEMIGRCHQHIFMTLTKRPERLLTYHQPRGWKGYMAPSNLWLGVTAENQETADQRIPILLQTPAAKRFVSVEPMLSAVNLRPYLPHEFNREPHCPWCEDCIPNRGDWDGWKETREDKHGPFLDWVICGGESGPGARPMHPDWPRSLRDQCQAAGVPFFFKQNGEWASVSEVEGPGVHHHFPDGATVRRVGKKTAGCLLDGREWKEFPA